MRRTKVSSNFSVKKGLSAQVSHLGRCAFLHPPHFRIRKHFVMKKYILSLLALCFALLAFGQQDHQYTLFMYNKLQLNPAYAGERGVGSFTGIYRNQWLGFEGSPESALVSFNTPFLTPRVGMGITVSGQKIGLQRDAFAQLAYSYDLINQNNFSLRMGLQGSIRGISMDFSQAATLLPGQDQSFMAQQVNDMVGNFGAGIYANYKDLFYAGVSMPKIYSNTLGVNEGVGLTARQYRHIYGMFGASIPLGSDLALMPALLVKYVETSSGAKLQDPTYTGSFFDGIFDADLNLALDIREKVTAGISYRLGGDNSGESVDLTMMLQATPKLGIGMAYDFTLSEIRDFTSGSFEAMIRYDLKAIEGGQAKDMSNPRFFF